MAKILFLAADPANAVPGSKRSRVSLPTSSYLELGRHLKVLARYDRPTPLSGEKLREISETLRDWYFDSGGWLYLVESCRASYFGLKDALAAAVSAAKELVGAHDPMLSDVLQSTFDLHVGLVIRQSSALRKVIRETVEAAQAATSEPDTEASGGIERER